MRAANAPSPRMRRAKTPFARCPCTKPAIRAGAGAVNHPHHINCMNHSSNKCQRALANALIPVNPFHPPPKGLQPNPHSPAATTRAAFASLPSTVIHQKLFYPISQNSQPSLIHALTPALTPVNPSIRRQRASSAPCTRPPRPHARPSPSRPSAVMPPKFLAQSHTISRKLSSNAPASPRSVDISKHWTKRQLLQAACGKRPTAIPPVLLHQARDLRRRRRRRR